MKDKYNVWNSILRRTYSAVNTANCHEPEELCRDETPRTLAKRLVTGKYKSIITILFVGVFVISTGILVLIVKPYDIIFKLKIILSDGGEIFEIWREPPVNLYLNVYLWNITNKEAFLRGDEKLRLQEVGPYVYRELMSHENVTFNANGTLTAIPHHPLVWVPELSVGHHEEDRLVLPHLALLNIAQVAADSSYFTRIGLNLVIRQTNSQPIVEMSPKEFMFGYESDLLTLGNKFLPGWIKFEKLGLIDRMYDFDGDYETVYTGEQDMRQSGLIDTYRGSTHIPQWDGRCGNVRGSSDGTKFATHIRANDTLLFFRKSMCRAQTLVRVNETVSSGFRAFVYKFENNSNDNGRTDARNRCFCKEDRVCPPAGLLDVHGCYYGFPIALSYPHFYGNPELGKDVAAGLAPDRQKHETYFVIQPDSGLPLDLAVRFQINLYLRDVSAIANVQRFSDMTMPLLWTETRLYNLPYALESRFRLYLRVLPIVEESAVYLCFAFGLLLLLLAVYKYVRRSRERSQATGGGDGFGRANGSWHKQKEMKMMMGDGGATDEVNYFEDVDQGFNSYASSDKRASSMSKDDLDRYYDSLVMTYDEFRRLKEDDIMD